MSNDSPNGTGSAGGPNDGNRPHTGDEWWDKSGPEISNDKTGSNEITSGNTAQPRETSNGLGEVSDTEQTRQFDRVPPEVESKSEGDHGQNGYHGPEKQVEEEGDVEKENTEQRSEETSSKRRILAWLGTAAVLIILMPVVIFGVAYAATDVPQPEDLANDQISVIYDNTGEKELTRIVPEGGNRRNVELKDVPDVVRNAVLAAEDRNFYTNPGFSLSGYGRAALGVLTGNSGAGGGSTITQQYVKNAVVGNDRTITRKAKEFVMSAKMAREWSKDEILQAYLNTIYFGRNGYGIAAASEAYFGKDVKDLTAAEGAVLAASIQRPSALDPWTNRPEAEHRWNYVLDGLVQMGVMNPQDRANQVYPETIDPANVPNQAPEPGPVAMIRQRVLDELQDYGISEQDVNTRGLRITTTIDPTVQSSISDAVENYVDQSTGMRTAIVSVEPKTGAVRGYYGGDDPNGWDYANSGLQTGSTFKIYALAAALDQNIPLSKMYSSAPVRSGDATLYNAGGAGGGTMPISEALRQSLNTPFIRLQRDLKHGPDDTAAMAHRLGVAESIPGVEKTLKEDNGHTLDGITLGQYLTRPLDMAVGLGTLTNDGVFQKTHFVQKVETVGGDTLYEAKQQDGDRRVSKAVATNVTDAMKSIAGYNNHALSGGRPSAAKTGTTQLGDSGNNKDAWMIGSTPQLATAVWVGNVDGSPLFNRWGGIMYGANTPADLWKYVMDNSLVNKDFEYFSSPESIGGQAGAPAPWVSSSETGTGTGTGTGAGTGTGTGNVESIPESTNESGQSSSEHAPAAPENPAPPAGGAPSAPGGGAPGGAPGGEAPGAGAPNLGNLLPLPF